MQLKLSCYQHKIDHYIYKVFSVSLMVTTEQKPIEDTQKIKRWKLKHSIMKTNQFIKDDNKKGKISNGAIE